MISLTAPQDIKTYLLDVHCASSNEESSQMDIRHDSVPLDTSVSTSTDTWDIVSVNDFIKFTKLLGSVNYLLGGFREVKTLPHCKSRGDTSPQYMTSIPPIILILAKKKGRHKNFAGN